MRDYRSNPAVSTSGARTVAEIMASLPRITLDPVAEIELGRKAYGYLAAGDTSLTEASIDLFATNDMLTGAIVAFVAAEARAGQVLRAVA